MLGWPRTRARTTAATSPGEARRSGREPRACETHGHEGGTDGPREDPAVRGVEHHHAEWLSLVETTGPFLTVPTLKRALPDGLDARPQAADDLRLAYAEWRAEPGLQARWVRWVLDELLGLRGATAEATEADPAHRVAEHGVTLRPDLVVRDHGADNGACPSCSCTWCPPTRRWTVRRPARAGQPARSTVPRSWPAPAPSPSRWSPMASAGRWCGHARARPPARLHLAGGDLAAGGRSHPARLRHAAGRPPLLQRVRRGGRGRAAGRQRAAPAGGHRPPGRTGAPRRRAADRHAGSRGPRAPRRAARARARRGGTAARSR